MSLAIVNAFHKNYSISLAEQIDRETSGNYKKILLTLGIFFCFCFCFFVVVNEYVSLFVCLFFVDLFVCFLFSKSFQKKINFFSHTAKPKSVAIAEGLHRAMKGVGTDDKALIRLLTHRTKLEIKFLSSSSLFFWDLNFFLSYQTSTKQKKKKREVCAAYSKLYDKELLDEIKSETSGWFRKALCYLIQESLESPRVYLPMGTLKKVRDVDV